MRTHRSAPSSAARWAVLVTVLVLFLGVGCAPAARTEVPREARGKEVHAERLKSFALADDYLLKATGAEPLQGSLDGCRDLRGLHTGYLWRCSVVRATTVVGQDAEVALIKQHQELVDLHCSAYPGLETTRQRLADGLEPRYLYEVNYHCPDRVMITIRFSQPDDEDLATKLRLGDLQYGPGAENVVSTQPMSSDVVQRLSSDSSQQIIMVVAVIRDYWMMPDPALE